MVSASRIACSSQIISQGNFGSFHLSISWRPCWAGWWDRMRRGARWRAAWLGSVQRFACLYPLPLVVDGRPLAQTFEAGLIQPSLPQGPLTVWLQPSSASDGFALLHPAYWKPYCLGLPDDEVGLDRATSWPLLCSRAAPRRNAACLLCLVGPSPGTG